MKESTKNRDAGTPPRKRSHSPRDYANRGRAPLPWPWALAAWFLLLILPTWAGWLVSQKVDSRILGTAIVGISLLTVALYWSDKRRAQKGAWRVPENTLHLFELLGGWPAALAAQRFLRHKTKKGSYQAPMWFIILLHQVIAFEVISKGWLREAFTQFCKNLLS